MFGFGVVKLCIRVEVVSGPAFCVVLLLMSLCALLFIQCGVCYEFQKLDGCTHFVIGVVCALVFVVLAFATTCGST